ncbi:50S ribosomal protein L3 [uncultured archaeon]|nr:50S ribosomal protein L3 [uncultured archaeon]
MRTCAKLAEPAFSSVLAFKVGMTHVGVTDASEAPSHGQEVMRAVTAVVFPKMFVYGIRFYKRDYLYEQPSVNVYDKALAQKVGIKNPKNVSLEEAKKDLASCTDVTGLAFADPSDLKMGIKHLVRFEVPVGGDTLEKKLAFLEKFMGKEIKAADVFTAGEFIDVLGISKGKGWCGVIKRFGVARQYHKSTGRIRHVGCLGAWHPPKVLFSVPMAGHKGYNYRTELNKQIVKIGTLQDASSVNVAGGYLHFGNITGDFVFLDGSIPGPAKRLLRVRKAVRATRKPIAPKLTYLSTASVQGA